MKKIIIACLILSPCLIAGEHEEVFFGTGKNVEDARQNVYNNIASQGKPINSVVSVETHETGTNNYITVYKIKTN